MNFRRWVGDGWSSVGQAALDIIGSNWGGVGLGWTMLQYVGKCWSRVGMGRAGIDRLRWISMDWIVMEVYWNGTCRNVLELRAIRLH